MKLVVCAIKLDHVDHVWVNEGGIDGGSIYFDKVEDNPDDHMLSMVSVFKLTFYCRV